MGPVTTAGLVVQAALESRGIATVSITVLPGITRKLTPPRALAVPFGLGLPLGAADDMALQWDIIAAAFALLARTDVPVLETYGGPRLEPRPKIVRDIVRSSMDAPFILIASNGQASE